MLPSVWLINLRREGASLDLQLIIEAFQRKMKDRPDQELLEEQQAKIFDMRRKMEEDTRTLVEQEVNWWYPTVVGAILN